MTNETTHWPDGVTAEQLMAYADGELPPREADQLAELVATHPALQSEVDIYVESKTVFEGAFDHIVNEPVPAHLAALVLNADPSHVAPDGGVNILSLDNARKRQSKTFWQGGWQQAVAACTVLSIGILLGITLDDGEDMPGMGNSMAYAGLVSAEQPLAKVLDYTPSAQLVTLDGGSFKSIQTFSTSSGTICREYETGHNDYFMTGIACRTDNGWRVEVLIANAASTTTASAGSYQLASGLDTTALDEVLYVMGALPGFDQNREACLIENNWNLGACEN
ncbi:MAG: hypothetical protein GXP16_15735 [Gammaproteobacteria bacterium]|nr:hypothetical protein [Gammaproteobacteria bacterium]